MEPMDFGQMSMPIIRRVYPSLITQQLVQVQPMKTLPGPIFYMDYKFGENKLTQRCNTGRWPLKMFWRAYRCLSSTLHRGWSKAKSFASSKFGTKRITEETSGAFATADKNSIKSCESEEDKMKDAICRVLERLVWEKQQGIPPEKSMFSMTKSPFLTRSGRGDDES